MVVAFDASFVVFFRSRYYACRIVVVCNCGAIFFYNYQKEADFQFENFASQVLLCTALKRARDLLELLSCFSLDC